MNSPIASGGIIRKIGDLRVCVARAEDQGETAKWASLTEEELRALPGAEIVRDKPHVLMLKIPREGRPAVYWKEFRSRGRWDDMKDFWRPSKGARAWEGALRLQALGLATAPVICFGEERARKLLKHRRSFLATEEIERADSFARYLWTMPMKLNPDAFRRKRTLLKRVGQNIGRLHNAGLYHGDLRPTNILVRLDNGSPEAFFIDTDRIIRARVPGLREAVHNLMQICFYLAPGMTLWDRARIIQAYAEAREFDDATRRKLLRSTFAWIRKRLRRRLKLAGKRGSSDRSIELMRRLLRQL